MKVIFDIPSDIERRILILVRQGRFEDPDHFIEIACRNQIKAEEGELTWGIRNSFQSSASPSFLETRSDHLSRIERLLQVPPKEVRILSEPTPEMVAFSEKPLWGQYYRYLPMKIGVRVLSNMANSGPVPLKEFQETAARTAGDFRMHLADLDRRNQPGVGKKLATSFPSGTKESFKRYKSQFLTDVRPSDGRLTGFMARLYLVSVKEAKGETLVGLTETGLAFSSIRNLVLEGCESEESPKALSKGEVDFLLDHARRAVSVEHEHMAQVLAILRGGSESGKELNERLDSFYSRFQDPEKPWTPAMVNTMRSGVTSRLDELGLISREEAKRGSPFIPTLRGLEWIESVETAKPDEVVG